MFIDCNTKKQGDIGLGAAIAHFTSLGYIVCIPLTDNQDFDLVVEIDGDLKRIQVKTTSYKRKNIYSVSLSIKGGNSKKNFVHKTGDKLIYDFLFVLTEDGNKYLIPKKVLGKSTINLGERYQQYKMG